MCKCDVCQDTGIVLVDCCSGHQCGCMAMPVGVKNCQCGQPVDEDKMSNYELFVFTNVEYLGEYK